MNKLYKIGKSNIEGMGLMAAQDLKPGDLIGLSHSGGEVVSEIGQYYNHSDNPNAVSRKVGNDRYVIASQNISMGGEITVDYRQQPELEQPEDFMAKAQNGGETEYRPQSEQITVDTIVDPNIPLAPTQDEQLLVDYYQPVVDWFDKYLKSDYYKTLLDKELPGGNVYSKKTKKEATKRQLAYTENYPYTDPKFDPYGLGNQYLSIYNYMEPDRDSIYMGAFYRPSKKYINMYGWQYPGPFGGGKNIFAHELGHTDDGIISGPSWDNWIKEHNKLVQSGEVEWKEDDKGDHSSRTEETRSDVIRLRYMLNEAGLFDTTGEYKEFTEEDYDKAFEKFGNLENTDSRIFKLYNKEDVIYLMNNMANLDTNPFEIVDDIGGYSNYMSKEGGSVHNPSKPKGRDGSVYLRDKNSVIKDPLNVTNDLSNTPLYEGQSPSTHYMADDDNLTAWPTLFQDPEGNWYRGGREEAERLGEVYTFDTREQMIDFARKGNWKSKMQEGGSLPKAQLGKGILNLIKGAAKTRPLTNETLFRGLHLNNQIRNLPMFKGLKDDEILEIMATTIPGHTGTFRKGQFQNTMNFGRDFDMAADHIFKFTRSPKGIFRIGNAPLAKEGTYPIDPNSMFNMPPVIGGDNFVVGTTPFSDIDFMSPERIKAFLNTARTTYDKNSPNGIQDIITKQKAILDGLPSVIRTEGVNVIEGNFPQFVGQQGTPMGVLQDIQLVKKDGGELPKAQGGRGLANIITRLGKPKVAKDYGFPLPSIQGFTPPFTAPLPLIQGRNQFKGETIFTKLHDQRTWPRVRDYSFEDMTGEYDWLVQARQHSNNIVQAKNPVFDSQGKLFSYDMPDLTQQGYIPLHQYLMRIDYDRAPFNEPQFGKDYILKRNEVYNVIRDLNSKGLFHLDLHTRNVMIKPDPTDLKILDWKLIDPVGLPRITQDINIQNFPPLKYTLEDGKFPFVPGIDFKPKSNNTQLNDYYNTLDFFKEVERDRHRGVFDYMEYSKKQWPWDLKEPFQFGGVIGRNILFPKKVLKKVAIDNRFLPTKKLNNILSKNFNQGQQLMLMQTLRQNPQLIQNNQIDLKTWQELTNLNLSKSTPFLTDITGIVKIPPGNTVGIQDPNLNIIKSKWTNLETGDDLGLYRYSNLLPSQFKKGTNIEKYRNTSGGTSYLYPLIKTGNLVNPLNYGFSMPGLFTNPYLPIHHDGLHLKESGKAILDPNAFGWLRGFVDERFPDTYMLKEAQTDLSKDNLYNTLLGVGNIKNTHGLDDLFAKTNMKLSELSARTDKKVESLERQLQYSQSKLAQLKDLYNNNYGLEWVNIPGYRGTINDLEREISSLESLIKQYNTSLLTGPDGRYSSIMDPLQASRIFTDPYFSLHNEMLPLLRNKGFKNIGIPTPSTIKNIQGWTGPEQVLYSKQGVFGHYDKLAKNQNLLSLPNTYELDNYKANIYNILNKPYKPFKQEGGEVYKYERSPFKDGKFVISNPEDLIIEISKTEVFTPEFKMGGTTKMNEYTLEKKFDNDKKLPYIEYTGDPDLEGRVYYDDETNEIVDVTTLELKKKRRHNRIKVIIDKYEEGNELTHTEKDVLNSLGLLD